MMIMMMMRRRKKKKTITVKTIFKNLKHIQRNLVHGNGRY